MVKYGFLRRADSYRNYIKPALGLFLMALAVTGFFYWESAGREAFQEDIILVASINMEKGHIMDEKDVEEVSLSRKLVPEKALRSSDFEKIKDMEAKQFIPKNSPLVLGYFEKPETRIKEGHSLFTVFSEWIFSRSSTLRSGDTIDIYKKSDLLLLGTYKVACVKNHEDKEVKSSKENSGEESTGIIHHIEVECTLEDYEVLLNQASLGETFILVQRSL